MRYYPVFLNLKDRKAVVIGGGKVAERKVCALVKAGAVVKVVSPAITHALKILAQKGRITHIQRSYRKGDINNAFVVIAGTSSIKTNARIAKDAAHLVNVIDTPTEGNFIAPSIVKRGHLTIAVSTEGCSPAVSKAIRKELEKLYGREFNYYLRFLGIMRKKALGRIKGDKERQRFLKGLASEKIFKMLRSKGFSALSKEIPNL